MPIERLNLDSLPQVLFEAASPRKNLACHAESPGAKRLSRLYLLRDNDDVRYFCCAKCTCLATLSHAATCYIISQVYTMSCFDDGKLLFLIGALSERNNYFLHFLLILTQTYLTHNALRHNCYQVRLSICLGFYGKSMANLIAREWLV